MYYYFRHHNTTNYKTRSKRLKVEPRSTYQTPEIFDFSGVGNLSNDVQNITARSF